jgi:hypothetical protein
MTYSSVIPAFFLFSIIFTWLTSSIIGFKLNGWLNGDILSFGFKPNGSLNGDILSFGFKLNGSLNGDILSFLLLL